MKRTDSHKPAGIKRSYSDYSNNLKQEDNEGTEKYEFHLISQNKALARELKKLKRNQFESQNEIKRLRGSCTELESLVSITKRLWEQLNGSVKVLSQSIENRSSHDLNSVDMVEKCLNADIHLRYKNPMDTSTIPELNMDIWTSMIDIDKEKSRIQEIINNRHPSIIYGSDLEKDLVNRMNFTIQSLTDIYKMILSNTSETIENGEVHPSSSSSSVPSIALSSSSLLPKYLSEIKILQTENSLMSDRILKLTYEITDMKIQLHLLNVAKNKYENMLIKQLENGVSTTAQVNSTDTGSIKTETNGTSISNSNVIENKPDSSIIQQSTVTSSGSATNHVSNKVTGTDVSIGTRTIMSDQESNSIPKDEKDNLLSQISLLTRQVEESEQAKHSMEKQYLSHFTQFIQLSNYLNQYTQMVNGTTTITSSHAQANATSSSSSSSSNSSSSRSHHEHSSSNIDGTVSPLVTSVLSAETLQKSIEWIESIKCKQEEEISALETRHHNHLSDLEQENQLLLEKSIQLELALDNIPLQYKQYYDTLVQETKGLHEISHKEIQQLKQTVATNTMELQVYSQLKKQMNELESLESTTRAQYHVYKDKYVILQQKYNELYEHILTSQTREKQLLLQYQSYLTSSPSTNGRIQPSSTSNGNSGSSESLSQKQEELSAHLHTVNQMIDHTTMEIQNLSKSATASTTGLSSSAISSTNKNGTDKKNLKNAQKKVVESEEGEEDERSKQELIDLLQVSHDQHADVSKELEASRLHINDLFMEIETISAEESKTREQLVHVIQQLSDYQSIYQAMLKENTEYKIQIEENEHKYKEMSHKIESQDSIIKAYDQKQLQIISIESSIKQDYHKLQQSYQHLSTKTHTLEKQVFTLTQHNQILEGKEREFKGNLEGIQGKCNDLIDQLQQERKQRMELQREIKKKNKVTASTTTTSSSSSSSSGTNSNTSFGPQEVKMLDLTLSMLRCSVCRDRFKSVIITRCFHLFCKECIDENLRNRHRKCPACGDKFGQDDVKTVFYGN